MSASNWVLGIEGDFTWAGLKHTTNNPFFTRTFVGFDTDDGFEHGSVSAKTDFISTTVTGSNPTAFLWPREAIPHIVL
jgi:hypothetical protein